MSASAGKKPQQDPPYMQNRAFRYGDGLFETILVRRGQVWNRARHLDRLLSGMETLGFDFDRSQWHEMVDTQLNDLCRGLSPHDFARIRLQVFRSGGGTYLPETDVPQIVTEITKLDADPWEVSQPLSIGIYHEVPLQHSLLSSVKSLNALPYIMAARHARQQGWDDALLRSANGFLAESSRANLFIVRSATLSTPHLKSGCLPGVMRATVLEAARKSGLQVMERPVTVLDLEDADEIFLTNVIRGLVPVGAVSGHNWKPSADGMRSSLMKKV